MRKAVLILILLFNLPGTKAHPVHVSICNIEIEKENMTVSIKVFKDDLKLAIFHNFGEDINLNDSDSEKQKEMVRGYFDSMFSLVQNKKDTIKLEFRNSDVKDDAIWYFYDVKVRNAGKLKIQNTIFLDIFSDQTNLVIINYNGKQNGYRFNYKNRDEDIDLKK